MARRGSKHPKFLARQKPKGKTKKAMPAFLAKKLGRKKSRR